MLRSFLANLVRVDSPWQPTDSDSLPVFMKAAVRKLQAEVSELPPAQKAGPFRGMFKISLKSFPTDLRHLAHQPHQSQLHTVMDCLERLCQWPYSAQPPTASKASARFNPNHYPTLRSMIESSYSVRSNLVQFEHALSPLRFNEAANDLLEEIMDAFNGLSSPESELEESQPRLSELTKFAKSGQEFNDTHGFVTQLHNALYQHFLPETCRYDWKSIIVNLRLNRQEHSEAADRASFGLFIVVGKTDLWENMAVHCPWQDLQICVTRNTRVAFSGFSDILEPSEDLNGDWLLTLDDTSQYSTGYGQYTATSDDDADEFCRYLKRPTVAQHKFKLAKDFEYLGAAQRDSQFVTSTISARLDDLIGSGRLDERMKLSLTFVLVRSFWQYWKSGWLEDDWGTESIHFMPESVSGHSKSYSINEPFLHACFRSPDCGKEMRQSAKQTSLLSRDHTTRPLSSTHPYPGLLALGITLLEIEKDTKLGNLVNQDGEDSNIVNLRHSLAQKMLTDQSLWPKGAFKPVQESIEICIKDFEVLGSIEGELRHNFYSKVVAPLKTFLSLVWSDADYLRMDLVTVNNASTAQKNSPADLPKPSVARDGSLLSAIGTTANADSSQFTSSSWFEKLDSLNYVLQIAPEKRNLGSRPIKLAILDTGVAEDYYQVTQLGTMNSIQGYKDFVADDDQMRRDATGHGTSCLRLLQKVYKHAEIYVGRVFESNNATQQTKERMVIAIEHAMNKESGWGVDIICLPSGFEDDYDPITRVIRHAKISNVLVFAAASNYGNMAGIYFPARLSKSWDLFCLFATTAGAKPTCEFNPAPMDSAFNFAILGENIQLEGINPLTGTSFSTIIAAGVAAQIIDFSMQPDVAQAVGSNETLRQLDGMASVFKKMSVKDNMYHCLTPWVLLGDMTGLDSEKKDIRLAVARKLAETVKARHENLRF